jgi:hypothetical protein
MWFAGTSAPGNWYLLKRSTTPNTFNTILDSLLVPAKGKRFIAADTACEQEVRISKEVYKAKGGSFRFENLLKHTALVAGSLYDCKMAVLSGHIPPEKLKKRGHHFDPSMERDIIGLADLIGRNKILENDPGVKAMQTIKHPDTYRIGWSRLQEYDVKRVKGYMYDMNYDGDDEDLVRGSEMDNIGATPNDPEIERDDEEGLDDPSEVLRVARLQYS